MNFSRSPRLFLKLNYRTKFPWKSLINTLIRVSQQTTKKIMFSTQHDFQACLIQRNAYLQLIDDFNIYRLDIALAAPKKSFDFLDVREKGRETTN